MAEVGLRRLVWGLALAAVTAPGVGVANARAATIAPVYARGYDCYVNPEPSQAASIGIVGSGFTPGDDIRLQGGGVSDHGPAAANGSVAFVTPGPILPTVGPADKRFTISALDATNVNAVNPLARTQIRVANFAFDTRPSSAKLTAKVRWNFSGFPLGKEIYAHFSRHGRQIGVLKFGRARAPCGTLSARARFFPLSRVPAATYGVQVDTSRRFSRRATPRITSSLTTYI